MAEVACHKRGNEMHPLLKAFAVLAGASLGFAAQGQEWPNKPIRVIVASAAGGVADSILRSISPGIEAKLNQRFILESKPGADGVIGMEYVARSAPDGYTMLLAPTAVMAVKQHMVKNLGFDPNVAFEAVAMIADAPLLAVVGASVPARSLKELADYVRGNPGKFNYGSPGAGSPTHLAGALFSQQTGNSMVYVPYKGIPPLIQALVANDVQLAFPTLTPVISQVRAGKLRPLAVMATQRTPDLPDVPSASEAGFANLVASNWWALVTPRGTSPAAVQRLSREIQVSLEDSEVKDRLRRLGQTPRYMNPAETEAFLRSESNHYKAIVEAGGIKSDQ
jgi:tripartite-type tricarboxylate transporter receptor subunit TctC